MRRIMHWLRRTLLGMRQRSQLMLMFVAGGLIPILIADVYMYASTRTLLIEQEAESQRNSLAAVAEGLREDMNVAADISKQLYFDEELEYFATHEFSDYAEILHAYREMRTIPGILKNVYHEVSSITLYADNPTLSRNEYIVYADSEVQAQDWYIETAARAGLPYWSWIYDEYSRKNCIRLTRMLYTGDMLPIGIVAIVVENRRMEMPVTRRAEETYLVYNGEKVLHTNAKTADEAALLALLGESGGGRVQYGGQDCLMTAVDFSPEYADETFTLVSFLPYGEIVHAATVSALESLLPQMLCVLVALGLMLVISHLYSARIGQLREDMHRAATGDFDITPHIEGADEIAGLSHDLAVMAHGMKKLMEDVANERVQKERLRARQREVEFKMLASQINPHFLFNTLETIRMQAVVHDQKEIAELTKMLAKLMRSSISAGSAPRTLREELQLVEYYLKIQDYRFHDRMRYEIVTGGIDAQGLMIMPLLIQPFVENAIVHGLEGKARDGLVRVRVTLADSLYICIEDNGQGMTPETLARTRRLLTDFDNLDREHVGICNVSQRIALQYGAPYGVDIVSAPGEGTRVTLCLPVLHHP